MNIYLDNIIFSLQKTGGVSVVWQQHLKRLLNDKEFNSQIIEYDNAKDNFFRQNLDINNEMIDVCSSSLLSLKRYLNLNSNDDEKHIFHSSYYRTQKGKTVINVTTVHDFTYEYFMNGFSKKIHSLQKNLAIINSAGIICISESTKSDLLKFLPEIEPNKIRVIYNGVDKAFKPLVENSIMQKKHPFDDYTYAIYVGDRQTGYKNFAMAVEACSLAKISLLTIGGGSLTQKELYYLKTQLGEGNYKGLLDVTNEDLNYYYNKAYCLLYPSFYEGFGMPVVEAQKAGCPVIATNSSSIPEVLGNNYLAINEPNSQKIFKKIKELSFGNGLRIEAIDIGFVRSDQFDWEKTYKKTREYYKELYK